MHNNTNVTTLLLRKTKSFNKSRYSRNRQYYRTGVFLCLWANIILVMGAYYFFYRLTLKFSYVWPIMLSLFVLIFVSYFSRNYIYGISLILRSTFCNISFYIISSIIKNYYSFRVFIRHSFLPMFIKDCHIAIVKAKYILINLIKVIRLII